MSGSVSLVNGHIDSDKNEMTPQEALAWVEDYEKAIKEEQAIVNNGDEFHVEALKVCEVVKQAIEKQIPKKYIREKTDFFSFPVIKCPNCTGIIGKVEFLENCELVICPRGCPCCGQAIDNRSEVNAGK